MNYEPQRQRALWLGRLLIGGLILITLRLIETQIIHARYYLDHIAPYVTNAPHTDMALPGSILASDHSLLAQSIYSYSLIADLKVMRQEKEPLAGAAQQLAQILHQDVASIRKRLEAKSGAGRVLLRQWLEPDQVQAIRDANISGIILHPTYKRSYPHGKLAVHVIGTRNQFHVPLGGIEHRYALLLDGKPSAVTSVADPYGGPTLGQDGAYLPPVAGLDVMLTLNVKLQSYVEACMDALWERETPVGATAVVIKPQTGAILAVCSRPTFDPNIIVAGADAPKDAKRALTQDHLTNIAAEQDFEPGSTLKVFLAAASLDAGIDPKATHYCPGHFNAGGRPISCWGEWATRGHGTVDMERMIAVSCNVAAAQTALGLGADKYIPFLRLAGFGSPTRAGFHGETVGRIPRADNLPKRDLASMGFGQGLSVSSLQLASAAAALANHGLRMHPHILAGVYNKDGTLYKKPELPEPTRICSEETAKTVLHMMQTAVENGTARVAAIEGVAVAAKTGTAQKWDPVTRSFPANRHVTSFLTICPADDPQFVIFVACDEPRRNRHGADTAGPVARDIADFAMRQLSAR